MSTYNSTFSRGHLSQGSFSAAPALIFSLTSSKLHHVGVLVVHVEEIDFVRQRAAIKDAFFDDGHVIAERVAIDAAGAYAAAGAFAADDQTVDAELRQMSDQRRAEKAAGAFFKNDHVARFAV